jgi:hypothetical protein
MRQAFDRNYTFSSQTSSERAWPPGSGWLGIEAIEVLRFFLVASPDEISQAELPRRLVSRRRLFLPWHL